jgi:hypothetical protein
MVDKLTTHCTPAAAMVTQFSKFVTSQLLHTYGKNERGGARSPLYTIVYIGDIKNNKFREILFISVTLHSFATTLPYSTFECGSIYLTKATENFAFLELHST